MRVAAIQFKADKDRGRPLEALEGLAALVERAAASGASLIVCPEMATTGYLFSDEAAVQKVAEPARGPGYQRLAEVARQSRCYVVCGYAESAPAEDGDEELGPAAGDDGDSGDGDGDGGGGPRLFNSARVIGPDGELLYNYRKRLLFDADYAWAQAGDVPYPSLNTPHGVLTAGICMDLNDDRFTAFLRGAAARVIAFCTNWVDEGLDVRPYWRYRLLGVKSSFIAANTYGWEEAPGQPRTRFSGCSTILGPDGRTLAIGPKEGDAIVLADVP
ncbi:MAG: nitrilase-related carbon-nitrogen hydrolase [Polyangia bacterium]